MMKKTLTQGMIRPCKRISLTMMPPERKNIPYLFGRTWLDKLLPTPRYQWKQQANLKRGPVNMVRHHDNCCTAVGEHGLVVFGPFGVVGIGGCFIDLT